MPNFLGSSENHAYMQQLACMEIGDFGVWRTYSSRSEGSDIKMKLLGRSTAGNADVPSTYNCILAHYAVFDLESIAAICESAIRESSK
jgi:hypothetical protein